MLKIEPIKLTNSEAITIIEKYQASDCEQEKNDLGNLIIRAYYLMVIRISKRFTSQDDYHYDDYISIGCNALVKAMQNYNGNVAYFSTYAYRPVIWEMGRYAQMKKDTVKRVYQIRENGEYNYVPVSIMKLELVADEAEHKRTHTVEDVLKCPTLNDNELFIINERLKGKYIKMVSEETNRSSDILGYEWHCGVRKIRIWLREQEEVSCY